MAIITPTRAVLVFLAAAGCENLDADQQAIIGASIGGAAGALIADKATDNRRTQRVITGAGTGIGGAIGASQGAQNAFCEGTTEVTRTARRDNRTGAIVYDTTRQTQSENCTTGRRSVPQGRASSGPQRIF
ncbi:MAG: hypothetical protein AAF244_02280 [Pseudomonadota bacterium]